MALNSRLVIASDLQVLFRDKDTALPLEAGVVTFYQDKARTILKPVWKLSGSPPNYSYVVLENPITLSAIGTFQDPQTGDDIVPYYFPYEGTPSDTTGVVELYYVTVYSAGAVLQFTREAWPNVVDTQSDTQLLANYVPNGQFLIHTDIPADSAHVPPYVAGEIRQPSTILAQGGWTFDRPNTSIAKDIVLFTAVGSAVTNPTASPKFEINIENTVPSAGDGYKDLRLTFDDVNKFTSTAQKYTYAFTGKTNTGSSLSASLYLIKNFSAPSGGGSATTETSLGNLTITNSFGVIKSNGFIFGSNVGKTIAAGDNVQLALRFPVNSIFDVTLADFILTPGDVTVTEFPPTPDRQFGYQSITPPVPAYDSSDLYLPLRLTPNGLEYDRTEIGKVYGTIYATPGVGELLCDGSQYETVAYSTDGIPYSRLQAKLFNTTFNFPIFGTGANYITAHLVESPLSSMFLLANTGGVVTATSDGTVMTGFTFTTSNAGHSSASRGLFLASGSFYIRSQMSGAITGTAAAGTSGFTVITIESTPLTRSVILINAIAATTLASKYFLFAEQATQFYVWFKVDGVGTDPAPVGGGTGILVNLFSNFDANDVAHAICAAISGCNVTVVDFTAASAIPAGSYFNVYSTTDHYYVWYKKDGVGTDPAVGGAKPVLVNILTADTAVQVAAKTLAAINSKYFAVPDFRGIFLRGWNHGSNVDPTVGVRWSNNPFIVEDMLGTFQLDTNQQHKHTGSAPITGGDDVLRFTDPGAGTHTAPAVGMGIEGVNLEPVVTINYEGFEETHPVNAYINYIIKY